MRYLLIGVIVSIVGALVSMIFWGMEKIYLIPGRVGFIFTVFSIVFSGTLVSGDRMRANFATETTEDRSKRNSVTLNSLLIALPNIIVMIFFYYLSK